MKTKPHTQEIAFHVMMEVDKKYHVSQNYEASSGITEIIIRPETAPFKGKSSKVTFFNRPISKKERKTLFSEKDTSNRR